MKPRFSSGVLFCLTAVVSWGIMFPMMGTVLPQMNPFFFTAIRYFLAAIFFVVLFLFREGWVSLFQVEKPWTLTLLGSLAFAGYGSFVFFGQQLAGPRGAITTAVFMALMPMLSVFINWIFRGIKPKKWTLVFIGLSFFGVLYSATNGDFRVLFQLGNTFLANIFITLGALCWVSYTSGAVNFPNWSALKYTTLSTVFGLPAILAINLVLHLSGVVSLPTLASVLSIWPQISYMVVFAAFVAVLAWNSGNKILNPINGVLFMDLVPVTAIIVASLNGMFPTMQEIVGASCTITALFLNNLYVRNGLKPKPRPTVLVDIDAVD